MLARRSFLTALALAVLAVPASASAATWSQSSTIVNQTGSTATTCTSVPGLGCMVLSAYSNNEGTSWTQQPQGQIPAASGGYDGSATWATSNDVRGQPLQSDIQYQLPDGTTWILDSDINYSGVLSSAWTASCAVAQAQQSLYGCVPTASGDGSQLTATYTFLPLGTETSVAAGDSCGAELAGGDSANCMTNGSLQPWPAGSALTVYNPSGFAMNISTNGMGTSCTAPAQGYCTVGTDVAGTPLIISPAAGAPQSSPIVWIQDVMLVDPSESVVDDLTDSGGSGWLVSLIEDLISILDGGNDDGGGDAVSAAKVAVAPSLAVRNTIAKAYGQPVRKHVVKDTRPVRKPKRPKVKRP